MASNLLQAIQDQAQRVSQIPTPPVAQPQPNPAIPQPAPATTEEQAAKRDRLKKLLQGLMGRLPTDEELASYDSSSANQGSAAPGM